MISVADLDFLFQNSAKSLDQDFPEISNDSHEKPKLENQETKIKARNWVSCPPLHRFFFTLPWFFH